MAGVPANLGVGMANGAASGMATAGPAGAIIGAGAGLAGGAIQAIGSKKASDQAARDNAALRVEQGRQFDATQAASAKQNEFLNNQAVANGNIGIQQYNQSRGRKNYALNLAGGRLGFNYNEAPLQPMTLAQLSGTGTVKTGAAIDPAAIGAQTLADYYRRNG